MKQWIHSFLLFAAFHFSHVHSDEYEGIGMFATYGQIDLAWLPQFLPYNPVIVEAGAFYGNETLRAAKLWPQGRIIAFEPTPHSFEQLQKTIRDHNLTNVKAYRLALHTFFGTAPLNVCHGMYGNDPVFGYASSFLPLTPEMEVYCKGPRMEVPCVVLDPWCERHQIDHIDLLRLELEGMELPVLQSSPEILKNTKIIYVKTFIHPYRVGMTQYSELKSFLEKSNFVLLSHWYKPGIIGHAVFLSRELFDAYFKKCLNIYLEI